MFLKAVTNLHFVLFLGGKWSGEASRNFGFGADDASVTIDFGENKKEKDVPKDVPVWITQSTVDGVEGLQSMG